MKKYIIALIAAFALFGAAACSTEADTVNNNLSKDAESFKIQRRIIFINGITDKELLRVEGRCSYETPGHTVEAICKVQGGYVRHAMVVSDNVTAVVQQLEPGEVSPNHYKFIFRPQTLIPDIDRQTSSEANEPVEEPDTGVVEK